MDDNRVSAQTASHDTAANAPEFNEFVYAPESAGSNSPPEVIGNSEQLKDIV